MKATIYTETIEAYDDLRNMADWEGISSHPVHNMEEMRKALYDKPKLIIEGRATMLNPFIYKIRQMGYYVTIEK